MSPHWTVSSLLSGSRPWSLLSGLPQAQLDPQSSALCHSPILSTGQGLSIPNTLSSVTTLEASIHYQPFPQSLSLIQMLLSQFVCGLNSMLCPLSGA